MAVSQRKGPSAKKTANKKAAVRKTASKKAASKKTASKKTASKKAASKKAASKKAASKKTASKKTASKKTAGKKTVAEKPAATPAKIAKSSTGAAAGAPELSTNLHQTLVMLLRHTEPFGRALTKKLKALDPYEDSEEREAAALALVDAVELSPELLSGVTELTLVSLEDINLLWPYWDGESDPLPILNLTELLALPNLERLANPSALPDPPLDARPLLALPKLRYIEMNGSSYCYNGSRYALWTNNKARALLEAAGFRHRVDPTNNMWIFERS